jgi:UDP-galactopyranose mutase
MSETVLCCSHLRWNFVFQRPQQLLTRCARVHRVIYFEEPMFDAETPQLEVRTEDNVVIAVPHLRSGTEAGEAEREQRKMVDRVLDMYECQRPVLWYYTPMVLPFTQHVKARAIVYDCMDELSLFHGAPPELRQREAALFAMADVVFTGGHSLYQYKRAHSQHRNIHPFPSSVDVAHFSRARDPQPDPADQAELPHPRVGFFGVIDERMDLALLDELAELRPDLQLVMIGPTVKIDPASRPSRPNIHWLGVRTYRELPSYLSGWDVAMLPFARNESTRFISPTKTPEYLAAGCPVVSTSITDVITPYGREGLAEIADTADDMSAAIDRLLATDRMARLAQADSFLADLSWEHTYEQMWNHVERAITTRSISRTATTTTKSAGAASLSRAPARDRED